MSLPDPVLYFMHCPQLVHSSVVSGSHKTSLQTSFSDSVLLLVLDLASLPWEPECQSQQENRMTSALSLPLFTKNATPQYHSNSVADSCCIFPSLPVPTSRGPHRSSTPAFLHPYHCFILALKFNRHFLGGLKHLQPGK